MAIKYNYTMSDNDVAAGIKSVGKRTKSLRQHVVFLSVSILRNWAQSGDVATAARRAGELLEAADDAWSQKIVNWFGEYAGFELAEEGGFTYSHTTIDQSTFQDAKKNDLFAFTPDNPPQPYNLREKIIKLADAAKKRREKGLKDGDDVPQEMVDGLIALVS